jgi:hypothetical protein
MDRIAKRLKETDQRVRECNMQLALYRQRIAARKKNPALAEQAERLLPPTLEHLKKLVIYRKRLELAREYETFLSPPEDKIPKVPHLPHYIR